MKIKREHRGWTCVFAAVAMLVIGGAFAATGHGQAPAKKTGAAKAGQPKFKAIWEPVNVPEDLELVSVHFVSPDVGWVAGGKNVMAGGVIYHTKDGGKTWELQVGDPESSDRGFSDLRFVDATHGFAVQGSPQGGHKLYSTSDGETWVPAGTVPEHRYGTFFTSPTTGFVADWKRQIIRTTDGGKNWQPVYTCRIKTEIAGLMRDAECYMHSIHFPNPNVGYAIGGPLPEDGGNVMAKTEDGGATWTAWVVLPGERASESSLWFLDENTGVLRAQADGKPDISFADGAVGWMVRYKKMTYTANGGKSWVSRQIAFPAMVEDSHLVARDRGYAVGPHGMVYRYRIVPVEYTAKGMLAAPALAPK